LKKIITILLLILGLFEIFYGVFWGRMRIYAHEAPFARALHSSDFSAEQSQAYNHYIDLFQDQWHIVAIFGVVTVVAALLLLSADRKRV
jgi:hypothetical protein